MQKETMTSTKSPQKPDSGEALPQPQQSGVPIATEYGGRKGPEATRYGDWEMNGKCVDF